MKANVSLVPPNTEYLELNFVGETATGRGNNQQYIMENLHDGTFRGTESRVGITIGRHRPRSYINPMEKWEEMFRLKVSRGYMVTKTQKMEQKIIENNTSSINGNEYTPIADPSVNKVVTLLLECTTAVLNQNYRIKIDDISDEMIDFGRSILQEMAKDYSKMSVAEFNNKLKTLYAAIPRRIDNLSKVLAKRKLDFNDIIADEQDLFDVMINRVRNARDLDQCSVKPTVLEAFHLDWRDVTEDEHAGILEIAEHAEVKDDAADEHGLTGLRFLEARNRERAGVGDDGACGHQQRVFRVPIHIEVIAAHQQPDPADFPRQNEVKQRDDREEDQIRKRIEYHAFTFEKQNAKSI